MNGVVVAFGGNAIGDPSKKEPIDLQIKKIERALLQLKPLIKGQILITHGNGSEIGNLLLQQEKTREFLPELPLDTLGAMTQGQIGYWIQEAIKNVLNKNSVIVITRVLVDEKDGAFKNPSKPIGPFYPKSKFKKKKLKGTFIKTNKGYRRVVPSPEPLEILEIDLIKKLMRGNILICCGGGGIPVIEKEGKFLGVEAVIDKDLCSSLLARKIAAKEMIMLTNVDSVYLNFKERNQKRIKRISVKDMEKLYEKEIFPEGSMGPKIKASLDFINYGGERVIISSLNNIKEALKGKGGTIIVK